MNHSLYQLLSRRTLWTVKCSCSDKPVPDVILEIQRTLDNSGDIESFMAVKGLESILSDKLPMTITPPIDSNTDVYRGKYGSTTYKLTVAPDGESFTLRSKEGVFIFTPQETK